MKKVLVLDGGFSAEHDVSLISGQGVAKALQAKGYDVLEHHLKTMEELENVLKTFKPDVVFNALHGNWGEDGTIQAFFDLWQIPYTHSGMEASLIGMNKVLTKHICRACRIKTADGEEMTFESFQQQGTRVPYPYVVKPCQDGSSVGVFIVRDEKSKAAVSYDSPQRRIMIEPFIEGRELTVAVIDDQPCAVTELKPEATFYDYRAKYTAGMTHHILPADLPDEVTKTALQYAKTIHMALGCRMVSRSDFRYNEKDGLVFLELNTAPGMTPLSLVPEQAAYIGLSYEDLCQMLVENASCRKRELLS
jgi:D-alanine-D-alanine ligase